MLKTRYDDYITKNDLDFVYIKDIKRSAKVKSEESNWHSELELELCLIGEGYVIIDSQKQSLSEGEITVINKELIHYTGSESNIKYDCLLISNDFLKSAGFESFEFESKIKSDVIKNLMQKLYITQNDLLYRAKTQKILLEILIELTEKHALKNAVRAENKKSDAVKKSIRYIQENYKTKLTLGKIAQKALMDKYTFSKEFKRLTKLTPFEYINRYRTKRALEMIESGTSVSEAALNSGFNNMSFFSKVFKDNIGALPSSFKRS